MLNSPLATSKVWSVGIPNLFGNLSSLTIAERSRPKPAVACFFL